MKHLFLISFLFFSICANAQMSLSKNYPVLVNLNLGEKTGDALDANSLRKGQALGLFFTVINPSLTETVKGGSCILQIQLGKRLKAEPGEVLKKTAFSEYFGWQVHADEKGAQWLIGKLIKDLPADFAATIAVNLQCAETGTSTISAQWLDAAQQAVGSLTAVVCTVGKK